MLIGYLTWYRSEQVQVSVKHTWQDDDPLGPISLCIDTDVVYSQAWSFDRYFRIFNTDSALIAKSSNVNTPIDF